MKVMGEEAVYLKFISAVALSKVFSLFMWSSTSAQKGVIWREGNFIYSQARHTKLCSHSPDPTYNTSSGDEKLGDGWGTRLQNKGHHGYSDLACLSMLQHPPIQGPSTVRLMSIWLHTDVFKGKKTELYCPKRGGQPYFLIWSTIIKIMLVHARTSEVIKPQGGVHHDIHARTQLWHVLTAPVS